MTRSFLRFAALTLALVCGFTSLHAQSPIASLRPIAQSNRVPANADLGPQTQLTGHIPGWVANGTPTSQAVDLSANMRATIVLQRDPHQYGKGIIAVVSAGTSDIPVAEEAQVTAQVMGNEVEGIYDIGVAGIHRLLGNSQRLASARVVVVCAGMEGALPSVIGGLVAVPVIAVPTSVGYGASFQGLAALLGMLNSCSPNVTVVNIDNGFGAAIVATHIARKSARVQATTSSPAEAVPERR